jgi:S1-C subfamily serine protease
MVKPPLLALLVLFVPVLLHAQSPQTSPIELAAGDIFRMASPSVVLIEARGEEGNASVAGSGFLITADGRILTNFHVIAHAKHATVKLANDDVYDPVYVLDVDRDRDIALLKIKGANLPYLKLGRSASAQVGDKLYTIGTPESFIKETFSERRASPLRGPVPAGQLSRPWSKAAV